MEDGTEIANKMIEWMKKAGYLYSAIDFEKELAKGPIMYALDHVAHDLCWRDEL